MSSFLTSKEIKKENIKYIFTDIDDTLTNEGKLESLPYSALWRLFEAGYKIIPVTGRPAGWCEMIARLWPVEGVIGENGGFFFHFENKKIQRYFYNTEADRKNNNIKLDLIKKEVLSEVPGSALASDQFTRLMDLAIDFCEDVPALSKEAVQKIVSIYEKHGACAKVSSIHVNGWFGDYNKISMIKVFCKEKLNSDFNEINSNCVFLGDSPNDEPSFKNFKHSIGVSNIQRFLPDLKHPPKWILKSEGGKGFVEFTSLLLD